MCDNFDSKIVDFLRSVMYASAKNDNDTLIQDVELLGKLIAKRDHVPYDPERNRLTQAFLFIQQLEDAWKNLTHLNDPTDKDCSINCDCDVCDKRMAQDCNDDENLPE